MDIELLIVCPSCRSRLRVRSRHAGRKIRCPSPKCGAFFDVSQVDDGDQVLEKFRAAHQKAVHDLKKSSSNGVPAAADVLAPCEGAAQLLAKHTSISAAQALVDALREFGWSFPPYAKALKRMGWRPATVDDRIGFAVALDEFAAAAAEGDAARNVFLQLLDQPYFQDGRDENLAKELLLPAKNLLIDTLSSVLEPSSPHSLGAARRAISVIPQLIGAAAIPILSAALEHVESLAKKEPAPATKKVSKAPLSAILRHEIIPQLRKLKWPRTWDEWPLTLEHPNHRTAMAACADQLREFETVGNPEQLFRLLENREDQRIAGLCGRLIEEIGSRGNARWIRFLCHVVLENKTHLPASAMLALDSILRRAAASATEDELGAVFELKPTVATWVSHSPAEEWHGDTALPTSIESKSATAVDPVRVKQLAGDELTRRGLPIPVSNQAEIDKLLEDLTSKDVKRVKKALLIPPVSGKNAIALAAALAGVIEQKSGLDHRTRALAILALGKLGKAAEQFVSTLSDVALEESPPAGQTEYQLYVSHALLQELAFGAMRKIQVALDAHHDHDSLAAPANTAPSMAGSAPARSEPPSVLEEVAKWIGQLRANHRGPGNRKIGQADLIRGASYRLAIIGPGAISAVPLLTEIIDRRSGWAENVRLQAAFAICKIVPDRKMIPTLTAIIEEEASSEDPENNDFLRAIAFAAIMRIDAAYPIC